MSKVLININNLGEIEEYKKIGITNFLFAIEEFSIGYETFKLESIPDNSYILMNRVMDTICVDNLKKIKEDLKRFKGIIYEDIAVYQILKDTNLELIWFQNHFTTNYESINYWLENGCSSAVISNELTKEEIKEILVNSKKELVFNILGKNNIMYSRRTLLTNFNKYNNLPDYKNMTISTNNNNNFKIKEFIYGTMIFDDEYFNYVPFINEIDDSKIKFYLILNQDLNASLIQDILNGNEFGNDGFLNKKTVYRMSEYDDRKK